MKMQLVTITDKKHGIEIKRELFDDCNIIDTAYCSIICLSEHSFAASGFSSIHKPSFVHDVNNDSESIDGFIKAVFSK
jgi:hypothetical protein